jgi:hypothetical protein
MLQDLGADDDVEGAVWRQLGAHLAHQELHLSVLMPQLGVLDVSRPDIDQGDPIALLRKLKAQRSLGATDIQDPRGGRSELTDERTQEPETCSVGRGDMRYATWLPDLVEIVGSGKAVLHVVAGRRKLHPRAPPGELKFPNRPRRPLTVLHRASWNPGMSSAASSRARFQSSSLPRVAAVRTACVAQ